MIPLEQRPILASRVGTDSDSHMEEVPLHSSSRAVLALKAFDYNQKGGCARFTHTCVSLARHTICLASELTEAALGFYRVMRTHINFSFREAA